MLKHFKAKFNEHPENIFSGQRRALSDVTTEESNYSFVDPIEEEN